MIYSFNQNYWFENQFENWILGTDMKNYSLSVLILPVADPGFLFGVAEMKKKSLDQVCFF